MSSKRKQPVMQSEPHKKRSIVSDIELEPSSSTFENITVDLEPSSVETFKPSGGHIPGISTTIELKKRKNRVTFTHSVTKPDATEESNITAKTPLNDSKSTESSSIDNLESDSFENVDVHISDDLLTGTVQQQYRNTVEAKLLEFLLYRQEFLDELLRHDGRGNYIEDICSSCNAYDGLFRCLDCSSSKGLQCCKCILTEHCYLPLHRIETWTGTYFNRIMLQMLGLEIQLGDHRGACPFPEPGPQNFVVFDISGIHPVSIYYCGCHTAASKHVQLLRMRWFPATVTRPQTAFTFDCLDYFHKLSLQSKINGYDFFRVFRQRSDEYQLGKAFNRYNAFQHVFRIWRNLHVLKRQGRGHDPAGIDSTAQGSLTVECPACPHPDKNLPADWKMKGTLMFLYILYLAVDANFKLKLKNRNIKDVELSPGWGAFVNEQVYQQHLANYVEQPEINSCESQHDAIVRAGIRSTPGYSVSGAGLTLCARHSLVRPNGVGDLQKGERYCNMDFIVLSALKNVHLPRIVITYDIGCQWSKNLRQRMKNISADLYISPDTVIDIGVPSWHINAHGEACRNMFSLLYMPGAGRTCGEEVETSWANTNPLATSLREMGGANRHEALDDHWNSWNFHKIIGFRVLLSRKFKEAYKMLDLHTDIYIRFTATFSPMRIAALEKKIIAWEKDKTKPNPYEYYRSYATFEDVRSELMREEVLDKNLTGLSRSSATVFLTMGFDIENEQHKLQQELKSIRNSDKLEERRVALHNCIITWRESQAIHMAEILSDLNIFSGKDVTEVEAIDLHLPSSLSMDLRQHSSIRLLISKEIRLRLAQAEDALDEIRRHLRIIKGLMSFKKKNIAGTGNRANTRMLSLREQLRSKTENAANRYRVAFNALRSLEPDGKFLEWLKVLNKDDIRGPGYEDDGRNVPTMSKGKYVPSWIWLVPRIGDITDEDVQSQEALSSEWAKAKARKERWNEEVLIVMEEMRRVIKYCEWRSDWWLTQTTSRSVQHADIQNGLTAYAHKQAEYLGDLAASCAQTWIPLLEKHEMFPEWLGEYKGYLEMSEEVGDDEDMGINEDEDYDEGIEETKFFENIFE